jgi:threonine aldolase
MPFGLSGAPATFQRGIDTVLIGMQDFATAYLDDLVVFSNMWAEHLEHMRKTLGALKSAGLINSEAIEMPVWYRRIQVLGTQGWKWNCST